MFISHWFLYWISLGRLKIENEENAYTRDDFKKREFSCNANNCEFCVRIGRIDCIAESLRCTSLRTSKVLALKAVLLRRGSLMINCLSTRGGLRINRSRSAGRLQRKVPPSVPFPSTSPTLASHLPLMVLHAIWSHARMWFPTIIVAEGCREVYRERSRIVRWNRR